MNVILRNRFVHRPARPSSLGSRVQASQLSERLDAPPSASLARHRPQRSRCLMTVNVLEQPPQAGTIPTVTRRMG